MTSPGEHVADALGELLRRDVRQRIYARLTMGIDESVNPSTYSVLSGLARFGPMTAAELGSAVGLDRSVVSRRATALESSGLLKRSTDTRDRRWTALTLTPEGQRAVETMRERLSLLLDDFLAKWPEEDAATFATILTAFTSQGPLSD